MIQGQQYWGRPNAVVPDGIGHSRTKQNMFKPGASQPLNHLDQLCWCIRFRHGNNFVDKQHLVTFVNRISTGDLDVSGLHTIRSASIVSIIGSFVHTAANFSSVKAAKMCFE